MMAWPQPSRKDTHTIVACALVIGSGAAFAARVLTHSSAMADIGFCSMLVGMLLEIRFSRRALEAERNLLEERVIERTQQLEEAQLRRTLELQRFAEFGRLSSQLLHDVATPLTVASLHLQQADRRSSSAIRQAHKSLQQLERYVATARKQLQSQSQIHCFDIQNELKQLLTILKPVAHKASVHIKVIQTERMSLYGDPVRFNQMIANLISNSIDAYVSTDDRKRVITIHIGRQSRFARISVSDNGKGISPVALTQVFEPFYTTKDSDGRGLGIGLSTVKRAAKEHFNGTICVNSSENHGTTFTLLLRLEPVLMSSAVSRDLQPVASIGTTSLA